MQEIKLRDYQVECIDAIHKCFKNNNSQLIQLPTGSGKTVIFLSYIKKNGLTALILCPTRDLVLQVETSCHDLFAGQSSNILVKTHRALNSERMLENIYSLKFDIIVIDEAHHSETKTFATFLRKYRKKYPKTKLLGVTATPERLDERSLLNTFYKLTFSRSLYWMIQEKYLCDIEAYRINTNQTFDDRIVNGDFGINLIKQLDNESRNNLILKTFQENCCDRKTLIFCLNVAHCNRIAEFFCSQGIKSASIHGALPRKSREKILMDFKQGKIQVLTNCQLLTEGFDEPSIEALIIARPTRSKSLYTQMIGRGMRLYPGKEVCYLYELTDNSHKICTFLLMHPMQKFDYSVTYKNGSRFSHMQKEEISLSTVDITKEKIILLEPDENNLFESMLMEGIL